MSQCITIYLKNINARILLHDLVDIFKCELDIRTEAYGQLTMMTNIDHPRRKINIYIYAHMEFTLNGVILTFIFNAAFEI